MFDLPHKPSQFLAVAHLFQQPATNTEGTSTEVQISLHICRSRIPINIASLDVKPSSAVQRDTRLVSYSFQYQPPIPEPRFRTWDCSLEDHPSKGESEACCNHIRTLRARRTGLRPVWSVRQGYDDVRQIWQP
ncbi:hypothetical protein SCLCIDRAFT_1029302 [Scleroderma citrinum Foug A]|uniref:Uncharacterized protein n=1 Tax=Scleroderma citrinum Foug A TaxID=1036808 RepID=A0A0C3DTQ9_9AGAM|nr:hypothetical protein SCLCIDRAFT_1029302 [Scleroderma citrinum Foug A]